MYKLFTLALFALVLSACGGPPAPLSDSCRTFNPFAADCTGEEAEEVQRETCIFNPGFHPNCRGDAGAIAGYCRDTNNPNNVLHEYCAEELTAESLTAAYTASCKVTPEIRDDCAELLTDFCKDPDDPFHAGCRTTDGIGLKQATLCLANLSVHPTCTDLLANFCDDPPDRANYYHAACDDSTNIDFLRARFCEVEGITLDMCESHRTRYCTTVVEEPDVLILRNFRSFCNNVENIESFRTETCNFHFTILKAGQGNTVECEDNFRVNCLDPAKPTNIFYKVCENILQTDQERAKVCFDTPTLDIPSGENVDTRGCGFYIELSCNNNLFNTDIDEQCPMPATRDSMRKNEVDSCDGRTMTSFCIAAYDFCEMNRDNSACVDAPIRPNRAAWEDSFPTELEPFSTEGNKFLTTAEFSRLSVSSNVGATVNFVNTTYNNVVLDIAEDSDNRKSSVVFFTQMFNQTAYYYAGLNVDAKLGEPLTAITATGTWEGGLRAVIGNTLMPASVDMELEVTFNPPKINAFVPVNGNHFLLDGIFSNFGVISGTVNYGAFMAGTRTPVANRGTNGTLTGLIGDYGAVGAFHSTATGSDGYAGGFVVRRVPPPE